MIFWVKVVRSNSVMLSLNGAKSSQTSILGKLVEEEFAIKGLEGASGKVAVPVHSNENGLLPNGLSITIK